MSRRCTGYARRAIRRAGSLTFVITLTVACGGTDSTPSASSSVDIVPAPLATELVGTWRTSTWLDSSGSQQIWRIYEFAPDGRYDYTLALCRSSTDCDIQGQESGYAQAAGGILSLDPQTDSDEGPRAWPYVVGRDPDVGDIQLHLTLADGQIDIFYRD